MRIHHVAYSQSFQLIGLVISINVVCGILAYVSYANGTASLAAMAIAYTLGLRHGFDADHIATIDNSIRRLGALKKQSIFTGFFFALGHSFVVFIGTIVVALFSRAIPQVAANYADIGAAVATMVSVAFLSWLGVSNISNALFPNRSFGRRDSSASEHAGSLNLTSSLPGRVIGAFVSRIQSSWVLFPVGMLFGLSFETASEVALLATAAHEGALGTPLSAIILYPSMFMAGMLAVDSFDGLLMVKAFNWVQTDAVLRRRYNLVISLVTGAVALVIATVQFLSLYREHGLTNGILISLIDQFFNHSETIGILIVGTLLSIWLVSMRLAKIKFRSSHRHVSNDSEQEYWYR